MTAHEIRPKQLRALLLLLVLVPLIPIALMARFMSDALKGDRMDAIEHTQQFYTELLGSALRSAPALEGTPAERAVRLHKHIAGFTDANVSVVIVDGTGRRLAGDESPKGQPLAQERAPAGLDGLVQLFLARPGVIDDAVSGQQRIYIATGVLATLLVLLIAIIAAMAVSRQITLQELKSTSVAIVAHELRTPLASMRMLVDTLREGRFRNEQQLREYLDLIAGENERLRRIAENFLTFSRLDRGRQALELGPVAPQAVAALAVAPFAARLAAPGCAF
ncbi:MAG: histidine kinase dimerization/phospho-acceptor domain-containing protein, partial [Chthoniobacteraceae bacterium]